VARVIQTYTDGDLTVTFEPRRCIHAAACIRALPEVFDSTARPWIRLERAPMDAVIAAVHACPTGALRAVLHGAPVEIDADPVTINASRHGPLVLRGTVRVIAEDGTELVTDKRVALCRCGNSARMPLCDNSHRAVGFRDPAKNQTSA
jgi:uncharacterized Fe-S cluster protein YjdI/CDGSH-type Zn-finger protein